MLNNVIDWTLPVMLGVIGFCLSLIIDVLFGIFFILHSRKHNEAERKANKEKRELQSDLDEIKEMQDKIAKIKSKRGLK